MRGLTPSTVLRLVSRGALHTVKLRSSFDPIMVTPLSSFDAIYSVVLVSRLVLAVSNIISFSVLTSLFPGGATGDLKKPMFEIRPHSLDFYSQGKK